MKKLLLVSVCLLMLSITSVLAQNRTVTGTVTASDDGQPIAGATVVIKGTSVGTQTDSGSRFSINVSDKSILTFSFIGYGKKEVLVNGSILNVSLKAIKSDLNEVVVVGYGTQVKKDVTGSVGIIKGSDIAELPAASFEENLPGRVSGVQVTINSGLLGAAPTIRVRGNNTISGTSTPLYVLDGVPIITGNQSSIISTNPLGDINPDDIENISVLKDGSSTAIYGSRAANGVVLITTKKGKLGKAAVSYNNWIGFSEISKQLPLLNANQFIQISNEKFANATPSIVPQAFPTLDPNGKPYDTNWQSIITRRGRQQNHSLSISGASENSNYYFSGGYSKQEGAILANSIERYFFTAKAEQKALKIVTIGFDAQTNYTKTLGLNVTTNGLSGNVSNALVAFPNVPVYNADGTPNFSADNARLGRGANLKEIDNNYTNVKYILDNNVDQNKNFTLNGNSFVNVEVLKGLNLRSQIGINTRFGEDYRYWNPVHGDGGGGTKGYIFQQYVPQANYDWQNLLTYDKTIGDHKIGFTGGLEYQKFVFRVLNGQGSGLSNLYFGATPDNTSIISGSLSATSEVVGGDNTQYSLQSAFSRVTYSYKDRYLLSASYRDDMLSKLAPGKQHATLPGLSIGWRLSDEPFFKESAALSFINDLKLRGGFAKTGNSNIPGGNYPFASTFAPVLYGNQSALGFSNQGNPALQYEVSTKYDAGIDLSMFSNRVNITAEYFKNNNDNLVLAAPTAPSLGVPGNSINTNVGKNQASGFEASINTMNLTGKFRWTTNLNFTYSTTKVTALNNNQDIIFTYNIQRVGQPFGAFYGYQSAGVNSANGNPLYVKLNGQMVQGDIATNTYYNYDPANPTALVDKTTLSTADKKILGNSLPTYFGGFNNTFSYKGVDLNINIVYSGGNKVYNATKQESLSTMLFNNNGTDILRRWTSPGQVTDVPKIVYGQGNFINGSGNLVSRYLEDGSFIRAQNITLGYTLPQHIVNSIKLNRLRIYASVQNAFVFTKYTGFDPETNNTGFGVDFNGNPSTRTFVMGLNVGF